MDITIDKLIVLRKEYDMAVHEDGEMGELISTTERNRLESSLRDIRTSIGVLTQYMKDAWSNGRYA